MSFLNYYFSIFFIPTFIFGMQDNPLPDCFSTQAIENDRKKILQTCSELKAQASALASVPNEDPRVLQLQSAVKKLGADADWLEEREFINSFKDNLLCNSIRAELKEINNELDTIAARNNTAHDKPSNGSESKSTKSYILLGLSLGVVLGVYLSVR